MLVNTKHIQDGPVIWGNHELTMVCHDYQCRIYHGNEPFTWVVKHFIIYHTLQIHQVIAPNKPFILIQHCGQFHHKMFICNPAALEFENKTLLVNSYAWVGDIPGK